MARWSWPKEMAGKRNLKMTTQSLSEPLKEGTVVRIAHSGLHRAWIAEYRGPLGPKGVRIYRELASKKPRMYVEVREDQLEVLNGR